MSASRPIKGVKMTKARLISLTVSLSLLAFYLQAACGPLHHFLGGGGSWFDGH